VQNPIAHTPALALERGSQEELPRTTPAQAPTVWEQLAGVYSEPIALFQRLSRKPRWGQAFWLVIAAAFLMMTFWALKVDVDALQRPVLEKSASLTASQIEQTISVSQRFILPMTYISATLRNLFGVLAMGFVFWLVAVTTNEKQKPTFLHAVSAATIPNLILIPYMLMIAVVCMLRPVGARIPERLAPSGLAYYLQPHNARVYGLLAQIDPFIIGYFVLMYFAVRHVMRLKTSDAAICTTLAVVLTVAYKVYFWV
jgi:hypothetical protein